MIPAFLRLIAISLGAVVLTVMMGIFVRWMGGHQAYLPPPHPWFQQERWEIWEPPLQLLCDQLDVSKHLSASQIVSLQVSLIQDKWQLPCDTPVPVADYLARQSQQNWLLRVKGSHTMRLDDLVKDVSPFNVKKRFAVQADSQKVSMFLRKKAPEWLFAADSSSLLRFHLFASLWIETAIEFWPDFVILDSAQIKQWDARRIQELRKRKKRILWHQQDGDSAPEILGNDGVMTGRSTVSAL